jgi:hypothetical protein
MFNRLKSLLRNIQWYWSPWIVLTLVCSALLLAVAWKVLSGMLSGSPSAPSPMQIAPPASVLAGIEKQSLPQPVMVRVYPKAAAVKRLRLPRDVADDPGQQVISSADLAPSRGGYVTATVLDTRTGEAVTRVTERPRPLFELGGAGEAGVRLGLTSRGSQQAALYARQDLLRVGVVTIAGYGEVDADARSLSGVEAKAMLDAKVAW